jgi:hypothetical protein
MTGRWCFLGGPEDRGISALQVVELPAVTRRVVLEWIVEWFTAMAEAPHDDGTEEKARLFATWKLTSMRTLGDSTRN